MRSAAPERRGSLQWLGSGMICGNARGKGDGEDPVGRSISRRSLVCSWDGAQLQLRV